MRELPKNAVMERRMLTAEENIASCFNAPPKAGEHSSSRNVLPVFHFLLNLLSPSYCSRSDFFFATYH